MYSTKALGIGKYERIASGDIGDMNMGSPIIKPATNSSLQSSPRPTKQSAQSKPKPRAPAKGAGRGASTEAHARSPVGEIPPLNVSNFERDRSGCSAEENLFKSIHQNDVMPGNTLKPMIALLHRDQSKSQKQLFQAVQHWKGVIHGRPCKPIIEIL